MYILKQPWVKEFIIGKALKTESNAIPVLNLLEFGCKQYKE